MISINSAVLIVVVLLSLWVLWKHNGMGGKENLIGNDLFDDGIYTSGATMRRLGQIFTSTDQGVPMTIYNKENKNEKLNILLKKVGEQ